ncbi:hypothetical protein CPB83DRAFT_117064 [Crepidotus variabilis]|uniref:Uncharacterized protein n=1 Tax=Crepidotus variabilis TaxID=179855 RepID=A0A9P6E4G0_9AGAR|nr:hypothetical protein CPB83DRAFT_117064 [Crepidotus variabilis]
MPKLETLDIVHSTPTANEAYLPTDSAMLFTLKNFLITDSRIATSDLIRWLRVPTSAMLDFRARSTHISRDCSLTRSLDIFSGMTGSGIRGIFSFDTLFLANATLPQFTLGCTLMCITILPRYILINYRSFLKRVVSNRRIRM